MVRPVHGGTNIAELRSLGLRPEDVLDFSASINPLGAPQRVIEAMSSVDLAAYPDTECTDLRETLASRLGVSASHILVGNGSTELIHLTARAYLDADDSAVIFAPTFGEFEAACSHAERANVISIVAGEHELGSRGISQTPQGLLRSNRPRWSSSATRTIRQGTI